MTRITTSLIAAALLGASGAARANVVFGDATFDPSNYSSSPVYNSGLVVNTSQCQTCGDPGQAMQIVFTVPTSGGSYAGAAINNVFSYDPQTQGPITSITASVDKDLTTDFRTGNLNNRFRPTIEQDGNYYVATIDGSSVAFGPSGGTTGYQHLSASGLTASDFTLFDFATDSSVMGDHPNFAGDPIQVGLAQITNFGTGSGGTYTVDYDNLGISIANNPVAADEPRSAALLGTAVAGLLLFSGRSRRLGP